MTNINLKLSDISILNHNNIEYLDEILLDSTGRLKVIPFDEVRDLPQTDISAFCVKKGIYSIPTQELIDFLVDEIGDKKEKTIEIGAGNGAICKALGIRGTDSFMQLEPAIREHYEALGQTIVPYGEHIEKLDANEAVRKYKPEVVVGAWCTHKYNIKEHFRGGNQYGINEKLILERTQKYIHIGNEKVHSKKPILKYSHRTIKEPWIVSRSLSKEQNVIYVWEK